MGIPEMCFENLVKMQIEKLRRPCMQCVDLVFAELKRIAAQSETNEIARFSKFRKALNDCVTSMLMRHLEPCRNFVNQVIDIELAYVNTNHPDFISMDDVFTERANHHSQAELYKQIGSGKSEQNNRSQHAKQSVASNQNAKVIVPPKQQVKSAPSPPQNEPPSSANNGGKGWFGFGGKQKNESQAKMKDNNPFNNEMSSAQQQNGASNSQRHSPQQQQVNNSQRRRKSNSRQSGQQRSNFNRNENIYSQQKSNSNSNVTQREKLELLVIKRFIRSYFGIVKKNIADLVPKSIMFMLGNKSKQRLQQDLALALYKEEQFADLLSENPEIARKRKAANDLLKILQKALQIISEVSDYRISSKDDV